MLQITVGLSSRKNSARDMFYVLEYFCGCISTKVKLFLLFNFWFWYYFFDLCSFFLHYTIKASPIPSYFFLYTNLIIIYDFHLFLIFFLSLLNISSLTLAACIILWYESSYSSYPVMVSDAGCPWQLNLSSKLPKYYNSFWPHVIVNILYKALQIMIQITLQSSTLCCLAEQVN